MYDFTTMEINLVVKKEFASWFYLIPSLWQFRFPLHKSSHPLKSVIIWKQEGVKENTRNRRHGDEGRKGMGENERGESVSCDAFLLSYTPSTELYLSSLGKPNVDFITPCQNYCTNFKYVPLTKWQLYLT